MKVLVIPDVHLKPWMFQKAEELMRQQVADRAVCLGDLTDDWGHEFDVWLYEETFDAAIDFVKCFPDTLFCYGNHDLSYKWYLPQSGYTSMASYTVQKKLLDLRDAFPNENQLAYIHRIDNVLFSHAGVMDAFVKYYVDEQQQENVDQAINQINSLGWQEMWGDQSPIWLRPQLDNVTLYKQDQLIQVVGHTPMKEIDQTGNLISCDVFSTYRDGTPIGSQKFLVIDTETYTFKGL